jgi:type IV pilus assembly protein PilZ
MAKITLLPESETKPREGARPLMMALKEKGQLYSLYMPFLINGGIFVPAQSFGASASQLPSPGSKLMILLNLPEDSMKKTVTGKVVWVTLSPTALGAVAGVGVQFEDTEANRQLRIQIENLLAGILGKSEQRTQTV